MWPLLLRHRSAAAHASPSGVVSPQDGQPPDAGAIEPDTLESWLPPGALPPPRRGRHARAWPVVLLLGGLLLALSLIVLLAPEVFGWGALMLFLAISLCMMLRHGLMRRPRRTGVLTMACLFERLYRMAHDLEHHPQQAGPHSLALMRDLFEPLEALIVPRVSPSTRISSDGSTLLVPVPDLSVAGSGSEQTLVLRFAQGGRGLFTADDARLAG
ncbi:MAG: hypothetical protein RLZZ598_51, partial [Pseudomonadota bacterium]